MSNQIKLNIQPTTTDRIYSIIGYTLCTLMLGIAVCQYSSLPDQIPIHYNMKGEADGYGSKMFIFLIPILSLLMFLGINHISKYPHTFNYTVKITDQNALQQYTLGKKLLRNINLLCVVFFFWHMVEKITYLQDLIRQIKE